MNFNRRLLTALDEGCVIAHVPESLNPTLLDSSFQPYKDDGVETLQPEFAEFLELVMTCKIDPVDQVKPEYIISHPGAKFYRKHPKTLSLVTTLS